MVYSASDLYIKAGNLKILQGPKKKKKNNSLRILDAIQKK